MLATYAYDDLGQRASITRSNGATTNQCYDGGSRLTSLAHDLAGTAYDQNWSFAYRPADQIVRETSCNDLYDWPAPGADFTDAYANNSLNEYIDLSASGRISKLRPCRKTL